MQTPDDQKRQEAIKALVNVAILEGVLLVAVVLVYLQTNNVTYLVGGVLGSTLIFGPMILRWAKAHGEALKSKPNSLDE